MSSFNLPIDHSEQSSFIKNSHNAMELLVTQEVEKQFQSLPIKTVKYIKKSEVIAYALNRLPPLYATTKRGWQRQLMRGKTEHFQKIATAVRQGIVAVERDPLRVSDLFTSQDDNAAQNTLESLKVLLQREDLSWENLTTMVEQTLINTLRGNVTWRGSGSLDKEEFDWGSRRL